MTIFACATKMQYSSTCVTHVHGGDLLHLTASKASNGLSVSEHVSILHLSAHWSDGVNPYVRIVCAWVVPPICVRFLFSCLSKVE